MASFYRQVSLPLSQVLRIAWLSLAMRWQRALLVLSSLFLAVLFFAYLNGINCILDALWAMGDETLRSSILAKGYAPKNGSFGASSKDYWLLAMSLLICFVGITNAQLMAVTERFREIGTFKCLGALNSFVIKILVVEALYYGIGGGIIGGLSGVVMAVVATFIKIRVFDVLSILPYRGLLYRLLLSVILASFLSVLGVLYSGFLAVRMEPSVALRRED